MHSTVRRFEEIWSEQKEKLDDAASQLLMEAFPRCTAITSGATGGFWIRLSFKDKAPYFIHVYLHMRQNFLNLRGAEEFKLTTVKSRTESTEANRPAPLGRWP